MSVSRRRPNHLRLVPVAGGAWAAALAATTFPAAAALVALPLWMLTLCILAAVALMRGSRRPAVILLLTLAAAAAAASHVAVAQPARTEAERFALSGGRSVVVEATTDLPPLRANRAASVRAGCATATWDAAAAAVASVSSRMTARRRDPRMSATVARTHSVSTHSDSATSAAAVGKVVAARAAAHAPPATGTSRRWFDLRRLTLTP